MPFRSMNSPLGPLTVFVDTADGVTAIIALEFGRAGGSNGDAKDADADGRAGALLAAACDQLDAYFDGRSDSFDLLVAPLGTDFQRRVWSHLAAIPYGTLATYGEVAAAVGGSARAVGQACDRNPIPVILPCHRVVAGDGRLGGYSGGDGVETKRRLLVLEGAAAPALEL